MTTAVESERIMMSGLFGTPRRPAAADLAGRQFQWDQRRPDGLLRRVVWYNDAGERIGRGDLSPTDLDHFARHVPATEAVLLLTDTWRQHADVEPIVLERHTAWFVWNGSIYHIPFISRGEAVELWDGLVIHVTTRQMLCEILSSLS